MAQVEHFPVALITTRFREMFLLLSEELVCVVLADERRAIVDLVDDEVAEVGEVL